MRFIPIISVMLMLSGCGIGENLRPRMEAAASPAGSVQQTQFAYIGDIQTASGTYHVATQRLILTGMLAPRGLPHRLLLFNSDAELVAAYEYEFDSAEPLWCEGSRVYLFGVGSFRNVKPDARLVAFAAETGRSTGNVLDFAKGPHSPRLTREKRYGSSGGIEHDPWAIEAEQSPQ